MYGTITSVDGKWVFKANPTKDCPITEIVNDSRWCCIELAYDVIRDIKIYL
jgi:hypothetical protein